MGLYLEREKSKSILEVDAESDEPSPPQPKSKTAITGLRKNSKTISKGKLPPKKDSRASLNKSNINEY